MAKTAIVIGAGIVGLATARALSVRGYDVTIIERNEKAIGASIRNFGMIWPIGQPEGKLYERAIRSKNIWKQVCDAADIWYDEVGSLHLAYKQDEWNVLQELNFIYGHRNYCVLSPEQTIERSSAVVKENLIGSLYSADEIIIDPRVAISNIAAWLNEKFKVRFLWGKTVTDVCYPSIYISKEEMEADEIYVCNGADFETLYPELFSTIPLTKCKLQMMRMKTQPGEWRIGPALCGGLSLIHYKGFAIAPSLNNLKKRFEEQYAEYLKWGIHVMVCQNQAGELTIGDSHEYGLTHDPFDKNFINQLIIDYLKKFARFKDESIIETWNGTYPKLTNGETELILNPEEGVTIINGIGGAGMTLAFGLCEEIIERKLVNSSLHLVE